MRTTLLILTIGLFTVCGCQNSKKPSSSLSDKGRTRDEDSVRDEDSFHKDDQPILDSDILYESSFTHEFSSNSSKDSFNICIKGKTLLGGRVEFEIKNATGRIIYIESFPTSNIWDTMSDSSTQVTEKYILDFVGKSFNEKNFFSPAIGPKDNFMDDYSNKKIWDELKEDKTAIGFSCSSGYEDARKIAYIKSLKKAVIYFECC